MNDVPPSDNGAEKRVIGAILLQSDVLDELIAKLRPADFFFEQNAEMYKAAIDLRVEGLPVSASTVAARLKGNVDDSDVAGCISGSLPEEAEFWADRVAALRRLRALLDVANEARTLAYSDPSEVDGAFARVGDLLARGTDAGSAQASSVSTVAPDVIENLRRAVASDSKVLGIPTGWDWLDRVLDGLVPGAVTSIYAPTSQFKSAMVQNIAWRISGNDTPVLYFSTEMTERQVTQRIVALEAGLNIRWLRQQGNLSYYWQDVEDAAARVAVTPLWFNDRSVLNVQFVKELTTHMARRSGVKLVIVDLLDHVFSNRYRDNDTKNEAFVMQQLKDLAKIADVHVIVTSHVKKADYMMRTSGRSYLDLEEMKGSSAKSQDADNAISLVVVVPDPIKPGKWLPADRDQRIDGIKSGKVYVLAAITKNREGELVNIPFYAAIEEGSRMMPMHDPVVG